MVVRRGNVDFLEEGKRPERPWCWKESPLCCCWRGNAACERGSGADGNGRQRGRGRASTRMDGALVAIRSVESASESIRDREWSRSDNSQAPKRRASRFGCRMMPRCVASSFGGGTEVPTTLRKQDGSRHGDRRSAAHRGAGLVPLRYY